MPSVTCKIASKIKPEKWIEVEIGVDDDSGSKFWRLTAKSPVSFLSFNVTSGEWFPIAYLHNDNPEVPGIMLRTSEDDPFQGFDLLRTGSNSTVSYAARRFKATAAAKSTSTFAIGWIFFALDPLSGRRASSP